MCGPMVASYDDVVGRPPRSGIVLPRLLLLALLLPFARQQICGVSALKSSTSKQLVGSLRLQRRQYGRLVHRLHSVVVRVLQLMQCTLAVVVGRWQVHCAVLVVASPRQTAHG